MFLKGLVGTKLIMPVLNLAPALAPALLLALALALALVLALLVAVRPIVVIDFPPNN